jgi:homoserine O-acetyltransferase
MDDLTESSDLFESSDSARSQAPLRHAREYCFEKPLHLQWGGVLEGVRVVYETWGELNSERDNAILVCHALSGDSHVTRHEPDDDPGWWEIMVGPGCPVDTDRYFAICANVVGGCRGSTGPDSIDPATGRRFGADFPTVTVGDMVEAQRRLVDHLGIQVLYAVIGGSLGGHQALAWGATYPERVHSVIPMATSARLTSQAIAFDVVGRNAIRSDPDYAEGQYYGEGQEQGENQDQGNGPDRGEGRGGARRPSVGLALARMLGHITYLSQESMAARFKPGVLPAQEMASEFERKFSVGSYLAHQGERFVERFDANSYSSLSMAMDLFDLGEDPEALAAALATAGSRWLVVSFSSDWLFPPFQSREIVEALLVHHDRVTYCEVETDCGHDAFLLENNFEIYGELVRGFLAPNLQGEAESEPQSESASEKRQRTTRLVRERRIDDDHLLSLVPSEASVLDLGCGNGELLHRLRKRGNERIMGVERSARAIVTCTRRGIPVIHANLDEGLEGFRDGEFDCVVLSQTLQAMGDVDRVVSEMLRVGRRGIVSFPNAAFHANRRRLSHEGRVPESSILDEHQWFDAPPVRLFSILDFETFCQSRDVRILRRIFLDTATRARIDENEANLMADLAIFVLSGEPELSVPKAL